jgi:GTP-binding protein
VVCREGALEVKGRGELQLAVLIENMRREGFEVSVSPPKVLFKQEEGELLEPQEEVTVDVPTEFSGLVLERFGTPLRSQRDVRLS